MRRELLCDKNISAVLYSTAQCRRRLDEIVGRRQTIKQANGWNARCVAAFCLHGTCIRFAVFISEGNNPEVRIRHARDPASDRRRSSPCSRVSTARMISSSWRHCVSSTSLYRQVSGELRTWPVQRTSSLGTSDHWLRYTVIKAKTAVRLFEQWCLTAVCNSTLLRHYDIIRHTVITVGHR